MGAVKELAGGLDLGRNAAAIEVAGLRMAYGEKEVLRDVTFTVSPGEVIALLGPNGAGKTTTIEILEGFRKPSAGHVRVLGAEPARGDERWHQLLYHLSRYYEPYARPDRPPFDTAELIGAVGLTQQAGQRIRQLSGGQRRRLDVAIGIVGRPEVLFLDEPTAGFDPQARRDFHDLVHRLSDLDDTTILLTTHDLDEAEKLADRILILSGGRIVADGSPDRLARELSRDAQVRWSRDGEHFVHATQDATGFVRELFEQYGGQIGDLEVRRATLEDTYMAIVRMEEG
jgi:ABC-2 type transport system ATP-binding protein